MNPEHIAWCKRHFAMMADGCTWGVPRCGLVFQRRGNKLVNVLRMPWMEGMPIDAAELKRVQEEDFAEHKRHFEAAGVIVETDLPKETP